MGHEPMNPANWNAALDLASKALPLRLANCAQHRCNPSSASHREKAQAFCGLVSVQSCLRGLLTGVEGIEAGNLPGEDWFGLAGDHQTLKSSAVRSALCALENAQRLWLELNIDIDLADLRQTKTICLPEQLALWRAVMHEIRLGAHSGPPSRPESNQNAGEARQDLQQSNCTPSSRLDQSPAKAKNPAAAVSACEMDAAPSSEAQKSRSSVAGDSTSDHSAIQQLLDVVMDRGAPLTCSSYDDSSGQSSADLMMTLAHLRSADEAALTTIGWTHAKNEMLVHVAAREPGLMPAFLQATILETEYKYSYLMNEAEFAKDFPVRMSGQTMRLMRWTLASAASSEIRPEQAVQPPSDFPKAQTMAFAKQRSQMSQEQERSFSAEIANIQAMCNSFQSTQDHLREAVVQLKHLRAGLDDPIPDQLGSSSHKPSRMFADAAEPTAMKQPDPGNGSSRVPSAAARSATANQAGEEAERKAAKAAASLLQEEDDEKAAVRQKQKRAQRRRVKQAKRSSHGRESREDTVDEDKPEGLEGQPSNNLSFSND